jgi:hypothetical protein
VSFALAFCRRDALNLEVISGFIDVQRERSEISGGVTLVRVGG